MSSNRDKEVLQAIHKIEESGLSVYRPRRKERLFVKLYTEPLEELLPKISGNALKVLHALGSRMTWEDTVVDMSRAQIMKVTNLSEKTVQSALNELEELKIITRIGHNARRRYVLSEMYVKRGK